MKRNNREDNTFHLSPVHLQEERNDAHNYSSCMYFYTVLVLYLDVIAHFS